MRPAREPVEVAHHRAKQAVGQSVQVEFLIISIMSAVVPMIEANCGEMKKRDRNTLKRRIEKAVRSFIAGSAR